LLIAGLKEIAFMLEGRKPEFL